ncbi:MAG: methyl-accepting chemotaxis protein [Bacillota bacterium]
MLDHLRETLQRLNQEHADLRAPVDLGGPDSDRAAAGELQAFLARVTEVLTTLDKAVGKMGVKEALHVLQIRRLSQILQEQTGDVGRLTSSLSEVAAGVTRVAEDTHQAAEAAERMRTTGAESLQVMGGVLEAVYAMEGDVLKVQEAVALLVRQTDAAGDRLKAIRTVAGTSRLLALNAAIQAAHASDRSFAVVAQEMRRLSDRTDQLVREIEEQVSGMEGAITAAGEAIQTMSATASRAGNQARTASEGLAAVHGMLGEVSAAVQSIAAVAEEQAAATEEMTGTARDLEGRIGAASASMELTRNLSVSDVTEQAQAALGRFNIGSQSDRMRALLDRAASEIEATVERLVAQGAVPLSDLWDVRYKEIKGAEIAGLARLFRVDRVPPEGFNPPKYRTSYDQKIDLPLMEIADRYIHEGNLHFCALVDLNAFVIAHGRNSAQDWTGNYEQDLRGNRIKRIFTQDANNRYGARVGLPPALQDKPLIGPAEHARLPGPERIRPFLLQAYAQDSGAVVLSLNMPLFVQGRRWATVRIAYQPEH